MSGTGEILFRPTCSKCGTVLRCDVKYSGVSTIGSPIVPNMCPNCGCFFECIRLPNVNNSNTFYYNDDVYEITKGAYYG